MEAVLEQLFESPKLVLYEAEIRSRLDGEQKKRRAFHKALPDGEKVEFINGEIIYHLPVRLEHSVVVRLLLRLIDGHVSMNNLGFVGYEKIMISLTRNDYEPDICFFNKKISSAFTAKQVKFPAPDFIAEVLSPSTAKIDRTIKFIDYAAHGVSEYWIVDPAKKTVEQFRLQQGEYELVPPPRSGTLKSTAIKGFVISSVALFDETENLKVLQRLLK